MQISIPSDLALAAFDDNPYFAYVSPPITAVSQPIHDLGQAALDMLFTLMDGGEPESRGRILPTKLVISKVLWLGDLVPRRERSLSRRVGNA